MKTTGIVALSALIASAVAVPMHGEGHAALHHNRDVPVVWVTETDIDTVTVPVIKTVWVDGSAPTPVVKAASGKHAHGYAAYPHKQVASAQSSAVEAQPSTEAAVAAPTTTSSSTSVYVAPVPSTTSTSVYVAPVPSTTSTSVYVAPAPSSSSTSAYVAPAASSSSTSVYVAPVPSTSSTSAYVAPVPTTSSTTEAAPTTYQAPSTTQTTTPVYSASAYASSTDSAPASYSTASGTEYTGHITEYTAGTGSCGEYSADSELVVAISEAFFNAHMIDGNPNHNPLCHKMVSIGGVQAKIMDMCPGCKSDTSLDLSAGTWKAVRGDEAYTDIDGIKWSFV